MKEKERLCTWHTCETFCKSALPMLRMLNMALNFQFAFTHQYAKILMVNYRHASFRSPSILSASSHCPEGNSRLRASSCTVS